ncbi:MULTISPECIES: S9 family peptidase [Gammaproteobacteria]|uniref:S9 family peptidase n=1 Tax=Gammaproteobacteria TaxID=1236 RepID=UPI000DD06655|nr:MULTISPECIES: S9 family peptidase [Gammaproteobacteria]RTE86458.1 S9 family peptidase [Aliidiomarina sp. B3213]TCZ90987.1 S9 family peptidase [Lysobacter sp. N42]
MTRISAWLALALLTLSSILACGTSEANNITLEQIVTTQSVNQAITTDDGEITIFTRVRPRDPYSEEDGSSHVEMFMLRADGTEVPFVTGNTRVGQIAFNADQTKVLYLAKRDGDKNTSLYSIPLNGGESVKVLEHDTSISSFDVSDSGDFIAFRASEESEDDKALEKAGFRARVYEEEFTFTRAFLFDTESEEVTQVEFNEQVYSVQFRPGSTDLLVRAAPTTLIDDSYMRSSYVLINSEGEEQVRFDTEGKLGSATFSPNGQRLAIIGSQDRNDPADGRLYTANLRNGSVTELLPNFLGHVGDIIWHDNNHLVWLADVNTETVVVRHNVESDEQTTLLPSGQLIATTLGSIDAEGVITLLGHSPAHPREAFTLAGSELTRLTDSNAWIHDAEQPRQEVITYTARDGLELEGILVYPTNYREGREVPVIMAIHGGPEAHIRNGWNDRYSTPTWYMAQEGFATFFPNYRGSTGRGVEFSMLGQNDYAGAEFDDIVDAKEHLVEIGVADEDRVGITGGSYGGYASAWGATKQTEHFAASVMFVGISNNLSKFGTTDIPNEMHLVHARSYPWDKWQWYLERSPIYWAEQARTPILIMHGEEDTRVHPSQSMELYRYLKVHGNVPVRLVLYPGEGHGNRRAAAQLDYAYRMERWMKWYLVDQNEGQPEHELDFAERL